MNLASVISSLASGDYVVTRTAAGDFGEGMPVPLGYDLGVGDGRFRPGASSMLSIRASVQPAGGRDLLRLPEGLRSRQVIVIFTATQLQTADAPAGVQPDSISFQGSSYQVQTVEPWNESGGFYKALAAKVQS